MMPWREAAAAGIESLGMSPLRAESLPATAVTPRGACLDLVSAADMVVLLIGRESGTVKLSNLTATEEEILEARRLGRAVLGFVVADRLDSRQQAFVRNIQDWATGNLTVPCKDLIQLMKEVVRALRNQMEVPTDESRARAITAAVQRVLFQDRPGTFTGQGPWAGLAIAAPRGLDLDEADFFEVLVEWFIDVLLTGPVRLLHQRPEVRKFTEHIELGSKDSGRAHSLRCVLTRDGLLALGAPIRPKAGSIEEAALAVSYAHPSWAADKLQRALAAARALFDRVDPDRRVQSILVQAGISNLGHAYFAEPKRTPTGGIPIRMFPDKGPILAFRDAQIVGRDRLAAGQEFAQHLVSRLQRSAESGDQSAFT